MIHNQLEPGDSFIQSQVAQFASSEQPNAVNVLKRSLQGLSYFGTSYCFSFLEVCSGTAILTQAVRYVGLTTLEPVDLSTGWDLTVPSHCRRLKDLIRENRPLFTHLAPTCRIFSQAFHPPIL